MFDLNQTITPPLYLPCALCHFTLSLFIYLFYFFLQCPHLYICIVCMYIWLNCIYLYLNVYCQCLMLTVCAKGLRVTQFQFSVCMYCTCGRIDNKADLTWLNKLLVHNLMAKIKYEAVASVKCLYDLTGFLLLSSYNPLIWFVTDGMWSLKHYTLCKTSLPDLLLWGHR